MLLTKFYSNLRTLRFFKIQAQSLGTKPLIACCSHSKFQLYKRNYTDESNVHNLLPSLTDDPKVVWPGFFRSWKNFFTATFFITRFLDKDFTIGDFAEGSKQALSIVSNALANEDYESIKDMVTEDTLQRVQKKISTLNSEQKRLIAIDKEDIYITFPYDIDVMIDNQKGEKMVEILVVFHSLKGLSKMKAQNKEPPINMGLLPEYQRLMFVCNYRFIRDYTNTESSWTIKMINHFMPIVNQ